MSRGEKLFNFKGLALVCSLLMMGCAKVNKSSDYLSECVLPKDQSGTLDGRWSVTPIPVAFKQGDFSASEQAEVATAVGTWNDFYGSSKGFPLIDVGDPSQPRISNQMRPLPGEICSTPIIAGNQYKGDVVIHKITSGWPSEFGSGVIAITQFCPMPKVKGQPLPWFESAVIFLNYENFFRSGKPSPDLQSVLLHELGHMVGLNHSCELQSKASGMPNCSNPKIPSDYFDAVLFPIVNKDASLGVRRDLRVNDQGRANCLYGG